MKKISCLYLLGCVFLLPLQQAWGDFHLWNINEVFSSSDGSVQFIELTTTSPGQHVLAGHTLVVTDADSNQTQFNFQTNLVGNTQNQKVLLATEDFALLTGLTPDYTIPPQFVPRGAGTLNFGEGADVLTFSKQQLPLNGVQSVSANLTPQIASPTNFAGLSASVSTESYATYNPVTSVLNLPALNAPGIGVGNVNFVVNLQNLRFVLDDFFLYTAGIEPGNSATQFQNDSVLYVPGLVFQGALYEFEMFLLSTNPFTFGDPNIISVIDPVPDQIPDPQSSELQQSIERGEAIFAQVCSVCHGPTGGGGFGPNLQVNSLGIEQLRNFINIAMPFDNPTSCQDNAQSSCATDAANYVFHVIRN